MKELNCKPSDLAVVETTEHSENLGQIVKFLGPGSWD
jgi:hypothetical protein